MHWPCRTEPSRFDGKRPLTGLGLGLLTCALVAVLLSARPARADMETAMAAFEREDFAASLAALQSPAAAGNHEAQFMLGYFYTTGKGTPQDYIQAHHWFNLASASGHSQAQRYRDEVAELMTPEQVAEAQKLARAAWQRRVLKDAADKGQVDDVTVREADELRLVAIRDASVRERPEPNAAKVASLGIDEQVHVVGRSETGWVLIAREGAALGWLHETAIKAEVAKQGTKTETARATLDIDFGHFHALVIGNNDYQALPKLKSAIKDAKTIAQLLKADYGYEVKLLVDATRRQILAEINRYRDELSEEDNLLIYYAGHGTLDRESDTGYWLPVDADPDNDINWIANAALSRHLKAMVARHVLVVADSCFSGTLFRDAKVTPPARGAQGEWLQRMAEKRSRTAITSGSLEPVVDGGADGHSVFAKAFIDALKGNTETMEERTLFDRIS